MENIQSKLFYMYVTFLARENNEYSIDIDLF